VSQLLDQPSVRSSGPPEPGSSSIDWSGLERLEEEALGELQTFLQGVPPPVEPAAGADGAEWPPGRAAHTAPLSEGAVLDQLASLFRGERYPKAFVADLLTRQVELLAAMPNVTRFDVPAGQAICIVGDVHGQLADLLHIFRTHGLPAANRPYLFNGDFVDRGEHGVEVCLALFALQQLHPRAVFLNRGNHEDRAVTPLYVARSNLPSAVSQSVHRLWNVVTGTASSASACASTTMTCTSSAPSESRPRTLLPARPACRPRD
jgi:hypothetical protein